MGSHEYSRFGKWRTIVNARFIWTLTAQLPRSHLMASTHISLDHFPGTRWLDPHHSTSPLMSFMESRHCPVWLYPLYRWSASWVLSILTWQCLSCMLTWRDSLHVCLARTTLSESETHELVNSVASPSQCPTSSQLPSQLPKWPIPWWPTHRY